MKKFSKLAVTAATTAALATGALAPTAAAADDVPQGGSAMWLYSTLVSNLLNGLDQLNGGADVHPTEKFGSVMLSSAPFIIALYPLQLIAEAEVRLQAMLSSQYR